MKNATCAIVVAVSLCCGAAQKGSAPPVMNAEQWREDLRYFARGREPIDDRTFLRSDLRARLVARLDRRQLPGHREEHCHQREQRR